MSKILYVIDNNEKTNYNYEIVEDTIIYHYAINSSSKVEININKEEVKLIYYYNNINYDNNEFSIDINHNKENTQSEIYNHGVNVKDNELVFKVNGKVNKNSSNCICNQDNQIINMNNGKSIICPNLLIDNFDGVSNHAAYIGKFKDEDVFYLMSRGISKEVSYRLLLNGFLINSDSIEMNKIDIFLKEIEKI